MLFITNPDTDIDTYYLSSNKFHMPYTLCDSILCYDAWETASTWNMGSPGQMDYPLKVSEKLAGAPWFQLLQNREKEAGSEQKTSSTHTPYTYDDDYHYHWLSLDYHFICLIYYYYSTNLLYYTNTNTDTE